MQQTYATLNLSKIKVAMLRILVMHPSQTHYVLLVPSPIPCKGNM